MKFSLILVCLSAFLWGQSMGQEELVNGRAYNFVSSSWTLLTAIEAGNKLAFAGKVTTEDGSAKLIKEQQWEAEMWPFNENGVEAGFIWRFKSRSDTNKHNSFSYFHPPGSSAPSPQPYFLRRTADGSGKWKILRAAGWGVTDGEMCLENIARTESVEMRPCVESNRMQAWGIYRAE